MATIHGHGHRVELELGPLGKPRGGIYFGVELELEVKGERKWNTYWGEWDKNYETTTEQVGDQVEELLGDFVQLKHDGSLEYGIEIVTRPASLTLHQGRWKKFFQNFPSSLVAKKTCGMHVHMSRAPFTQQDRSILHQFFNAPGHEKLLRTLAGRNIGPDAEFAGRCQKEPGQEEANFPKGKYERLNLMPKDTMEVRIFASTTQYKEFMGRLEFVAAIAHQVAANHTIDKDSLVAWVHERPQLYPNLIEII